MYAKRFRLDRDGNLHVDRLFCCLLAADPALLGEVAPWLDQKRLDTRAAKAEALLAFEEAWRVGDQDRAQGLARRIHVLMLAQRTARLRRRQVSRPATQRGHTAPKRR